MTSDKQKLARIERRLQQETLDQIETSLDDSARRDYQTRLDTVDAARTVSSELFSEQARLRDRQTHLRGLQTSKWLWGTAILGAVLALFSLTTIGMILVVLCALVSIAGLAEASSIERKLEAIGARLDDLLFRWIAAGIDGTLFQEFGRLEVRLSRILGEEEAAKYRDDYDGWWLSVQAGLLERAKQPSSRTA